MLKRMLEVLLQAVCTTPPPKYLTLRKFQYVYLRAGSAVSTQHLTKAQNYRVPPKQLLHSVYKMNLKKY